MGVITSRYKKKVRLQLVHYHWIILGDLKSWVFNGAGILIVQFTFQERLAELAVLFNAKHENCNAPRTRLSEYKSLGKL